MMIFFLSVLLQLSPALSTGQRRLLTTFGGQNFGQVNTPGDVSFGKGDGRNQVVKDLSVQKMEEVAPVAEGLPHGLTSWQPDSQHWNSQYAPLPLYSQYALSFDPLTFGDWLEYDDEAFEMYRHQALLNALSSTGMYGGPMEFSMVGPTGNVMTSSIHGTKSLPGGPMQFSSVVGPTGNVMTSFQGTNPLAGGPMEFSMVGPGGKVMTSHIGRRLLASFGRDNYGQVNDFSTNTDFSRNWNLGRRLLMDGEPRKLVGQHNYAGDNLGTVTDFSTNFKGPLNIPLAHRPGSFSGSMTDYDFNYVG